MNRKEIEVEAEKYGIENYESCIFEEVKGWETDIKAREQSFKDGAEFVYKELEQSRLSKCCQQKNARAMEGQKKMEIAFESFWKNNNKLNNILNGVNHGIMDKISIGEFAQLCFKEGFNADKFGGIE